MFFSKLSATWIPFIYLLSFCYFHSKLITILMALLIVICFNTLIINRIYLSLIYIFLIVCFYIFDIYIVIFLQAKFRYLTILLLICLLTIDHSESWRRRRFRRFTRRIGRAARTASTAIGVIRAIGAIAGAGKRSADDVCFYKLFFVTK